MQLEKTYSRQRWQLEAILNDQSGLSGNKRVPEMGSD